jgi:hypothetical protein
MIMSFWNADEDATWRRPYVSWVMVGSQLLHYKSKVELSFDPWLLS